MIAADGLTNPFLWRRCSHVFEDATVTPRRCLACKAVDHGAVAIGPMAHGGMAGYRMGGFPFGFAETLEPSSPLCPQGHPVDIQRLVSASGDVLRRVCRTCSAASLEERMARACVNGHAGRWSVRPDRGLRCLDCESQYRRRSRAASITRGYAEAAHA